MKKRRSFLDKDYLLITKMWIKQPIHKTTHKLLPFLHLLWDQEKRKKEEEIMELQTETHFKSWTYMNTMELIWMSKNKTFIRMTE